MFISNFASVLCILALAQVSCKNVFTKWTRLNLDGIRYGTSYAMEGPLSTFQCMARCAESKGCISVNVNRQNLSCELSTEHPENETLPPVQRPGWTIYYTGCPPLSETPDVTVLGNARSVGSEAVLQCQSGYIPSNGTSFNVTTVCGENGFWSKHLTCVPATCKGVFHLGITQSGTYLAADEGTLTKIYCDFNDPTVGYTYIAMESIDNVSSLSNHFSLRNHVIIRHAQNTVQYESKIMLLPQYRNTYNISVFINENPDFSPNTTKPYMFIGFIPATVPPRGTIRGYTCFDQEFTFVNCDDKPNNCFIIHSTISEISKCYRGDRFAPSVENGWKLCARQVDISRNIPMEFMFPEYTVWMGGCGCASFNCETIEGMAFGLPFSVEP